MLIGRPSAACDRGNDSVGISDVGELDEPHVHQLRLQHFSRGLDRQPRLADAAWTDQRDEPSPAQASGQGVERTLTTDERGQRRPKIGAGL